MRNSFSRFARVPEPRVPGLEQAIELEVLAAGHDDQPIPAVPPPAAVQGAEVLDFDVLFDVEPPPPPEEAATKVVMLVVDGRVPPPQARYITVSELEKINRRLTVARQFAEVQGGYMPELVVADVNGIYHIGDAEMTIVDNTVWVEEHLPEAFDMIAVYLRR